MARIRALDKNDVSDEVRIIFTEIESAFGIGNSALTKVRKLQRAFIYSFSLSVC